MKRTITCIRKLAYYYLPKNYITLTAFHVDECNLHSDRFTSVSYIFKKGVLSLSVHNREDF